MSTAENTSKNSENDGTDLIGVREAELELILSTRGEKKEECIESGRDKNHNQEDRQAEMDAKAWESSLLGLAFSGGGIRSATFNLGILQSLAQHKLLRRVDYLSTVSGGGYIGGWLTALLQREHHRLKMENIRALKQGKISGDDGIKTESNAASAIDIIEERLHPSYADKNSSNASEDPSITHLRSYSNYLTPKLGFFTADTWALITTYLRDVLLNQTILFLTIAGGLLLPRLLSVAYAIYWEKASSFSLIFDGPIALVIAVLSLTVAWCTGKNLAGVADTDPAKPNPDGTGALFARILVPLILIACLYTAWLPKVVDLKLNTSLLPNHPMMIIVVSILILAFVVWVVAWRSAKRAFDQGWLPMDDESKWNVRWFDIIAWGTVSAAILGLSLYGIGILIKPMQPHMSILVAPPLCLLAIMLTEVFHIGLASIAFKSQQREWLSRIAAWLIIISMAWVLVAGIAFIGPFIVRLIFSYDFLGPLVTSGWIGTTFAGVIACRSGKENETPGFVRKVLAAITPYLFIFGVLVILAFGIQVALEAVTADGSVVPKIEQSASTAQAPPRDIAGIVSIADATYDIKLTVSESVQPTGVVEKWVAFKQQPTNIEEAYYLLIGLFIVVVATYIFARRFDVNEFSLHHMYENRLTRCFLGATTGCRFANPFTGFSLQDDIPLWAEKSPNKNDSNYTLGLSDLELRELQFPDIPGTLEKVASTYPGPYPIINTAINLVGGSRLAWQERKAAPFFLSPLYCGFQLTHCTKDDNRCKDTYPDDNNKDCNFCIRQFLNDLEISNELEDRMCPLYDRPISECLKVDHAPPVKTRKWRFGKDKQFVPHPFRPTKSFASEPFPLTLGDAMATSGAAASPSMGYHTTPAIAFLLAIFNIRLGRWIGNPLRKLWHKSGPSFALWYLLREVFGSTNEEASFAYLSDGGHFDNLGIYELVRRRCRYIIACDAGADPNYTFEDLANATRKCRIDLGVDIDIDVSEIQQLDDERNNSAQCAIGEIHYPENKTGTLLYIKASRLSDIPTDVLQYAIENPSFPHQTTADQFFSESQFESYRRLGLHIGDHCLSDSIYMARRTSTNSVCNLAALFRNLRQRWYKRSSAIEQNFTKHAGTLDSLYKRLGETGELAFLDEQFFPEWRTLPTSMTNSSGATAKAQVAGQMEEDQAQVLPIADANQPLSSDGLSVLPSTPEEFRAGFYFCNSLIQLAENVYLDLNLENEHDHPDNSGWMNLFRHLSWSGMFRITWTISASTYGRRFRRFCRRYLDLSLGNIGTYELQNKEIDALLKACEKTQARPITLNVLERQHVAQILNHNESRNRKVFQLEIEIMKPSALLGKDKHLDGYDLKFNFGYAVVEDEFLLMLRVQDHLRRMELGRLSLEKLFERIPNLRLDEKKSIELLHELKEPMAGGHMDSFKIMFEEVKLETRNHRSP